MFGKRSFYIWIFLVPVLLTLSCSTTTTADRNKEEPKPEATFNFALATSPTITWNTDGGTLHIENSAIVTSTNNVGGTVTSLDITWYVGGTIVSTSTHPGGHFAGYGTLTITFHSECSRQYEPDVVTFRIVGRDDNGNAIDRTLTYSWDWDVQGSRFINRGILR